MILYQYHSTSGHLAHLVTLNKDGSPQISIVWVGLDGDEIVCAHQNLYQKLKNIQSDARASTLNGNEWKN